MTENATRTARGSWGVMETKPNTARSWDALGKGYGHMAASRRLISSLHGQGVQAIAPVDWASLPRGLPQDSVNDYAPSAGLHLHVSVGLEQFFLLTVYNPDMPRKHCWIPEPSLKRAPVIRICAGKHNKLEA